MTAVFLQDACLKHRFIRSRDSSNIVERPERLRAVKLGVSAAIARLEGSIPVGKQVPEDSSKHEMGSPLQAADVSQVEAGAEADILAEAMGRMNIAPAISLEEFPLSRSLPVRVLRSSAQVNILNHAAVKFVHGDIDGDVYLEKLKVWARDSADKIAAGQSEIPEGLSQGDLYLSPGSLDAMQGALGTVCEAVDTVMHSGRPNASEAQLPPARRAFVAIRPPGHHCGEDTPSGFCFLNNVAVAAAHAHLTHGIQRVVIFDVDLHHGNGTQSIAWQINEESYRAKLESEFSGPGTPSSKPGLQVYYGSVHDILSYPCEDGKIELVQAASVSIHGPHGQYIENVHLEPYESEEQFWRSLYERAYSRLLKKAQQFLESTGGKSDETMVFISCGFDASEHEYASMSRHARKVPTSFFHRFTQDACSFANKWAHSRLVSVLEGGYSDKALSSGTMAHILGLVDGGHGDAVSKTEERQPWWSKDNVNLLEKLSKKRRGPKTSLSTADPDTIAFLDRTTALLSLFDPASNYLSSVKDTPVPPSSMSLRSRRKADSSSSAAVRAEHQTFTKSDARKTGTKDASLSSSASMSTTSESDMSPPVMVKKLPKVILKVGPPPKS